VVVDVFLHVPKASGTTIRTIISREYGTAATVYYEPENKDIEHRAAPEAYLRTRLAQGDVRLITGHLRYGIHDLLCQPCRYFSMLRDPIDRALSDYFYAFVYPLHRYREQIVSMGMSFADFLAAETPSPADATSYFLGGLSKSLRGGAEAALFHVRHSILAVGISERFDESLLLTAHDLGWRPPLYLRRNVTRLDDDASDRRVYVREEARGLLRAEFAGDYQVYDTANRLLSQRISHLGDKFLRALDDYRELQAALSRCENGGIFDSYTFEQDDALPQVATKLIDSDRYHALSEYLRVNPAKAEDRRSYVGYLDNRSPGSMAGWAMDLSRSLPISVTLRRGDETVTAVRSDVFRPDVAAAGYPASHCGFHFILDPPAEDPKEFTVCFEDSPIQLHG